MLPDFLIRKLVTIISALLLGSFIDYVFYKLLQYFEHPLFFVILQLIVNIVIIYTLQTCFSGLFQDEFTEASPGFFFLAFFFTVQTNMFRTINANLDRFYNKAAK